jgi:hypothetical protein
MTGDVALLGIAMFLGIALATAAGELLDAWLREVFRKTHR